MLADMNEVFTYIYIFSFLPASDLCTSTRLFLRPLSTSPKIVVELMRGVVYIDCFIERLYQSLDSIPAERQPRSSIPCVEKIMCWMMTRKMSDSRGGLVVHQKYISSSNGRINLVRHNPDNSKLCANTSVVDHIK